MNANADGAASPLSKAFTSRKFDLLDAMARDPKVKPVDFHIAYVIVQHVNQVTRMAVISDNKLQLLLHRDRKALTKARKRLVLLGWPEVRTGRYGKATEYRFRYERIKLLENIRLDGEILAREEGPDSREETPHRTKPPNEAKTDHKGRANNWEKPSHRAAGVKASTIGYQRGENITHSGDKSHPLHLQTPRDSLPVKGSVATHAHDAHVCAYDRRGEFNEVAGRLEYEEDLPRDEAEHLARTQLGFDEGVTNGRQGVGAAPPTVAKRNPEEGISDDHDHPYHG